MRIEPLSVMPPKMERPVATGTANSAAVDHQLLSNDPELPVAAVQEREKSALPASYGHSETVWLEKEQRTVYRVVDEKSGEVISQIPSEEVMKVSKNISELLDEDVPKKLDVQS
ncbi:MAG: flagellar protein FlaG [Acidobacteriaceae bacterium]